MKGILDTHVFLWWESDPGKLSAPALAFLLDPANTLYLSVVSIWEVIIKLPLGKLNLTNPLPQVIAQQQQLNGVHILPVTLDHVFAVEPLPPHHKDPFDRLLVAQANVEGAVLLTADPVMAQYPVTVLW
jgi:PIN domain nuclease of toxin-antitoxin system